MLRMYRMFPTSCKTTLMPAKTNFWGVVRIQRFTNILIYRWLKPKLDYCLTDLSNECKMSSLAMLGQKQFELKLLVKYFEVWLFMCSK